MSTPRYTVQKAHGHGWNIVDTTGKEPPHTINAMRNLDRYEIARLTSASIGSYEEFNKQVAQEWCETWNLVEQGYCGSCRQLIPGKAYPAGGFNVLYRRVCFDCACSQES